MRNKFILSLALLCIVFSASAQVGIGTISPDASASLDMTSTTKGFLMPRMTAAQRTAIPAAATGLLVYQTDAATGFWYYTGTQWIRLVNTADAPNLTTAYAANTSGSIIAVVLAGTNLAFPNAQLFSPGITVDGSNSTFTVVQAGRYHISYQLNTTAALLMNSRIMINGAALTPSILSPSLSVSSFNKEVDVDLTAGSTINVQFYGIVGLATLLTSGGASLSIIRLN